MDLMEICAATSTGDGKQRVNRKTTDWCRQLRLRKTAVEPPTMQSEDKSGPKKIVEEWERSAAWPSSQKPTREAQQSRCSSRNTLRFACSQCRDGLEYVPKDLVRHFEENHKGIPPVFSCHTCTFITNEFSYLQVHLLSHKDTFSSCSICNDGVQRTWSELSAHLAMCHCQNGKYSCEMCQTFSTGDIHVFLEHMSVHNLGPEGANEELSLRTKYKNPIGPETTTQALHCHHCGYEAPQKWLIAKHIKTVHVCQNGNQREKKKKEAHSLPVKPGDPVPKMKPRLTRSAVREMCWLTQDCLSLPGREFLDKYCHLSDPQTTLEETQQFLMKSVAGETGDQKWTKALKTVLSNVPQDATLHPKSENGITLDSSDLTFLTVKNKITVAQNGASYSKRLKRMTAAEKETVLPESAVGDACCVVDQNGCQSNLNDHTLCAQMETKLNNDTSSVSAENEPLGCTQMQENRENQELETTQEEHNKQQESMNEDGINVSGEPTLMNEPSSVCKVSPRNKRNNRRQKRKARYRKVDKRSSALKIVLKKNPVKEQQWVSQSSLSPSAGGPAEHGLPDPHTEMEKMAEFLQKEPITEVHLKKRAKASKSDLLDPSETSASVPQVKPGVEVSPTGAAKPVGSKNMDGNEPVMPDGSASTHRVTQDDTVMSLQFSGTEVDRQSSAGRTARSNSRAAAEMCSENARLQTPGGGTDDHLLENEGSAADGVLPHSGYTESSPVSQPVITPQGKINVEDSDLTLSSEPSNHSVEGLRDGELPVDSCSDLLASTHLPVEKAIQQDPSGHRQQPVPKNLERTLKLVAINPSQPVKRPAGDQPVVVLNHPDADIPEVARIMEVVNRYRGDVQKVILSRRTLDALSANNAEVPKTNDPAGALPGSAGLLGRNSVQERFILKLKLRRLSRKKYEVVGAVSPSRGAVAKFRCWFCGRVFESREVWTVHRQRHLMEWKRPNCENS